MIKDQKKRGEKGVKWGENEAKRGEWKTWQKWGEERRNLRTGR